MGSTMAGPLMSGLVTHKYIQANGIKLHYVEAGSGPTVLLLHGFPDFWYSWRHQIPALVDAGYHVVAPDLRGYGESEMAPVEMSSSLHVVGDLVALLDELEVKQALVVAHDFGAIYGPDLCLFRPDRVKALLLLGVPYFPRTSECVVDAVHNLMGDDVYLWVFQEPGKTERLFETTKNEDILSAFFTRWADSKNLCIPPFIASEPLPEWLSKEELKAYGEMFDKSGWTGCLNHYRAFYKGWELKSPWTNMPFPAQVPLEVVMARQDITMKMLFPDAQNLEEEALTTIFKMFAPGLKAVGVVDGTHFMHQEKPDELNKIIIKFLQQYKK